MAKAIITPELGSDKTYRVLLNSYYKPPIPYIEQLGTNWKLLGCFMDSCCYGTKKDTGPVIIDFGKNGIPVVGAEIIK